MEIALEKARYLVFHISGKSYRLVKYTIYVFVSDIYAVYMLKCLSLLYFPPKNDVSPANERSLSSCDSLSILLFLYVSIFEEKKNNMHVVFA